LNILWICTDQQRADTLGCMGNKWVHTPNLDRLASEGVVFENAYSQSPVCAPSRGSFLSGRYPRTCGPRQNGQDIDSRERLLPRILADNGYYCGLAGKLHLTACHPDTGRLEEARIDDGYHVFSWSHHPQPHQGTNWPANAYNRFLLKNGRDYITPDREDCTYVQTGVEETWHQTTWCADEALRFMENARVFGKDWMFSLNCFDPHHPFDPPADYLQRYLDKLDQLPLPNYGEGELADKPVFQQKDHEGAYDTKGYYAYDSMNDHDHRMIRAAYWAMVDLIDKQVGRLLDYLDRTGQREDTLIVFHSDHGENLGDHGMYLKGPYFYENNVHVPLLISWPGKIPGGRRSRALVELTDLAPTLCDAAGIPAGDGFQGKSFWKLLTGEADLHTHRSSVYSEYYNSNINHRDPLAFATMVCDGRYKLVRVHGCREGETCCTELYDLQEQPLERKNHYRDPAMADVKMRLLETMCDRMAGTCDPLPVRKACW
jgi:arylsulfatase